MSGPERPFGLGPEALVALAAAAWRAHDGQWFLKVAARHGLAAAMELNEAAIRSLARIELRELKRLAGLASLDDVAQVAEWYRLVRQTFGGAGLPATRVSVLDADTLVVENERCFGEIVAERSGYGHLRPGEYPPCRGWLARQRAWGEALSARYRFAVAREPCEGCPCRYVVRRAPREP